ncbi:MAG TPA: hypothetical protein VIR57_17195, partial [Chloroflexota bacterium]
MQSASVLRLPVASRTRNFRPRVSDGLALFAITLTFYLATAAQVVLVWQRVVPDALSRVASAYFVLYSRDPHLAAIGFVRNPLPSLLTLPLLPFKAVFPAMTQMAFAASIASAIFAAAAVYQLHQGFADAGLGRRLRLLLCGLFAIQPILVL